MSGNTLRKLRNSKKLKLEDVAERLGISVSQISRFESEEREPRRGELRKLADLYEVPVAVLFDEPPAGGVAADLISWVSAGAVMTPEGVQEREDAKKFYDPDLDPSGDWIALRVDGDSMDRISPPDSVIFVNLKDTRLVANACYVIADTETGEATYKRYRPNPERWEPVSTNKSHKAKAVGPSFSPRIIGRVKKTVLGM